MRSIEVFKRHLREKRAIKIISGIDNYNLDSVKKVVSAAQMGLASAVDVACDKEVFEVAAKNTTLYTPSNLQKLLNGALTLLKSATLTLYTKKVKPLALMKSMKSPLKQ